MKIVNENNIRSIRLPQVKIDTNELINFTQPKKLIHGLNFDLNHEGLLTKYTEPLYNYHLIFRKYHEIENSLFNKFYTTFTEAYIYFLITKQRKIKKSYFLVKDFLHEKGNNKDLLFLIEDDNRSEKGKYNVIMFIGHTNFRSNANLHSSCDEKTQDLNTLLFDVDSKTEHAYHQMFKDLMHLLNVEPNSWLINANHFCKLIFVFMQKRTQNSFDKYIFENDRCKISLTQNKDADKSINIKIGFGYESEDGIFEFKNNTTSNTLIKLFSMFIRGYQELDLLEYKQLIRYAKNSDN